MIHDLLQEDRFRNRTCKNVSWSFTERPCNGAATSLSLHFARNGLTSGHITASHFSLISSKNLSADQLLLNLFVSLIHQTVNASTCGIFSDDMTVVSKVRDMGFAGMILQPLLWTQNNNDQIQIKFTRIRCRCHRPQNMQINWKLNQYAGENHNY